MTKQTAFSFFVLLGLSCCCLFFSCSNLKNVIKANHAFYAEKQGGGASKADENGNELPAKTDTIFTVFIEATAKDLMFDSVWYNGRRFGVHSYLLKTSVAEPGLERGELTKTVKVAAAPGHYLYQLELTPHLTTAMPPGEPLVRVKKNKKAKSHYYQLQPFVLIDLLPMY